jgi:hypothetical protein
MKNKKDKGVGKTIYLLPRHIEYLDKTSIHLSPWVCSIIDTAIKFREKNIDMTKILEDMLNDNTPKN